MSKSKIYFKIYRSCGNGNYGTEIVDGAKRNGQEDCLNLAASTQTYNIFVDYNKYGELELILSQPCRAKTDQ